MPSAPKPSTSLEARSGDESLLTGRWAPVVLAAAVVVAYLPSLSGGALNFDDPWLLGDAAVVRGGAQALRTIWTDLGREARLSLGAEYLPLRDTSHWLEHTVHGLSPRALRVGNLALYVAAVLLIRGALRRIAGGGVAPEVTTWLFAMHPLHVESVAWLAGRKDVLAMLFVAAALRSHAGDSRWRPVAVPALLVLASLSKTMAVAAIGLLFALDLLGRRAPDRRVYLPTALALALVSALHLHVGEVVDRSPDPLGGSRWASAAAMGRVWLDYVGRVFVPTSLSIVHDVPPATWDVVAVAGWALLAAWCVLGVRLARPAGNAEGRPLVLAAFVAFFVPLLPVSQVLVPLQQISADRYLFLSLLGPALLVAGAMEPMGDRKALGGTFVLAGGLALFTLQRADLFSDSVKVFSDARAKTETSAVATYQLGQALEAAGEDQRAIRAYVETLERSRGAGEEARRATNNLAKLHARHGHLEKAEKVLRTGVARWPRDPQIAFNLAETVARRPDRGAEAAALYRDAVLRFPEYAPGRAWFEARFGSGRGSPAVAP